MASIATRKGDDGTTGLLFSSTRVRKCNTRIHAVGEVDALNVAIGAARVILPAHADGQCILKTIQTNLIALMGELACGNNEHYMNSKFDRIKPEDVQFLDDGVAAIEARFPKFAGWATPGSCALEIVLEQARVAARAAERAIVVLGISESRKVLLQYINRLSDLLWLMAREANK